MFFISRKGANADKEAQVQFFFFFFLFIYIYIHIVGGCAILGVTTAHPWCSGHFSNINACGV